MSRSISRGVAAALAMTMMMGAGAVTGVPASAQPDASKSPPKPKAATPMPARLADGHLNLMGIWTRPGGLLDVYHGPSGVTPASKPTPAISGPGDAGQRGDNSGSIVPEHAPLKEPYKAQFAVMQKNMAAGTGIDPVAICLPPGMPRMMGAVYGIEILQTPGQITITSEWQAASRRIWLNEKTHPPLEEIDPTYAGHSIGHWEGDTLVVDTVGLRADPPINQSGLPHSDKMHLIERISLHDGKLVDDVTVDDPEAYEGPWKITFDYHYRPDLKLQEYVCEENNRNIGANGAASFGK